MSIGTIITYKGAGTPQWVVTPDLVTAAFIDVLYKLDLNDEVPQITYTNSIFTPFVYYPRHSVVLKNII